MLLGCSLYFLLPFEPIKQATLIIFALTLITFIVNLKTIYKYIPQHIFLLFFTFGVGVATWQVQAINTKMLTSDYANSRYWVVGQIEEVANTPKRDRVTIRQIKVYGIPAEHTPNKIKISASRGRLKDFVIGSWIATEAKLNVINERQFIDDFNFKRYNWLKGIGATGYVMGSVYHTSKPVYVTKPMGWLSYTIANLRHAISNTITRSNTYSKSVSQGGSFNKNDVDSSDSLASAKAVSVALLTGIKTQIPQNVTESFRSSGLAHILAISGLHLGLVGGLIFFSMRRIIGFAPIITLNTNTKKITAIFSLFAIFFYMLLAGATLPTIRAFIMLGLVFLAIVLERRHQSLRILCVAIIIVLSLWPQSIISASFQMSFAAALALCLWVEFRDQPIFSEIKLVQSITYFKLVWLTSLIAGLATMPIAAWHFHHVSFAGFIVNLIAIPLTGFWIMPLGLLVLIAMPFGLHEPFLYLMSLGVNELISIAEWGAKLQIGNIQLAGVLIASSSWWIITTLALSLLTLAAFKKWKIFTILMLITIPTASYSFNYLMADIVTLNNNQTILLREADGYYQAKTNDSSLEKRLINRYLQSIGSELNTEFTDKNCDTQGCAYNINNKTLYIPASGYANVEDCNMANIIIATNSNLCENIINNAAASSEIYVKADKLNVNPFSPNKTRVWD